MCEQEEQIILDYACARITREGLFTKLPSYADSSFLIRQFENAIDEKDSRKINFLSMIPCENLQIIYPIYKKLLLEVWHIESEDIARYFQNKFNDDKENISVLLDAIKIVPDYLKFDDMKYPYFRKLVYAIGAQPEPYNIEALEKLAHETNDEQIKSLALHQIKKRKELGRWEAIKNAQ
jgi:hypothetical protein